MSNLSNMMQSDLAGLRFCKVPPPISVGQLTKKSSDLTGEVATARSPVYASAPQKQQKAEIARGTSSSALRERSPVLRSTSPSFRQHPDAGYNVPKAFAANVGKPATKAATPAARGGVAAKKAMPGAKEPAKRLPSELELTKRELEDVRNLVETLRRQADEDAAQIDSISQDKEKVDTELAEALEQKAALVQQFNIKLAELEEQNRRIDSLQLSEDTLKTEVQDLQRKVVSLQEEHRMAMETAERRIAAITEAANKRMAEADAAIASLQRTVTELQGKLHEQQAAYAKLEKDKECEQREIDAILRESERDRMQIHNAIQDIKGSVRVYCRVRPVIESDAEYRYVTEKLAAPRSLAIQRASVSVPGLEHIQFPDRADHRCITLTLPTEETQQMKDFQFQFDKVFEPSATQEEVFEDIQPLVQSALDGNKVCIFAYGQTGSGKTYTMEGVTTKDGRQNGMIQRTAELVFKSAKAMQERGWEYSLTATYVEVYNDEVRDLLNSDATYQNEAQNDEGVNRHEIRIADGYTTLAGVTEIPIDDLRAVHDIVAAASRNRKTSITAMNNRSSRSHAFFSMKIVGTNVALQQQALGVVNLVDLAGCEKVNGEGDRLKEATSINKSLSALSDVVSALAKGETNIPYRNSKLTHMLQPYMGNESKTLMFVNVSPSELFLAESLNSLRFAAKVNSCEIALGVTKKKSFKK